MSSTLQSKHDLTPLNYSMFCSHSRKVVLSHCKANFNSTRLLNSDSRIRFKTTFLTMTSDDFGCSHTVKNELDLT